MSLAVFKAPDQDTVDRAYNIAWDYLKGTGQLSGTEADNILLAKTLVGFLQKGERHPLRLANLAITAFQRDKAYPEPAGSNRYRWSDELIFTS